VLFSAPTEADHHVAGTRIAIDAEGVSCKAKAVQQKLSGKALLNFVKQCEFDALAACANLASPGAAPT
jgi:hypothetical protein